MRSSIRMLARLLIVLLLFCGCTISIAEEATVIASFYPVYIFAENLLEGTKGIGLSCITAPSTGCLHDYQLLAGDMAMLSSADAFLICGAGMEGYLNKALEQFPDLNIIDCSVGIELLDEGHEHHHHADEHDEDGGEEEKNAHMWLDPLLAIRMVENMAGGLAVRFPGQAEKILSNAAVYTEKLTQLDSELQEGLEKLSSREIVTFHEAFPYFARRYQLNVVAVMTLEPEEPLSPAAMTELTQEVREHGCPPLFTEPQYASRAALIISRETGAPIFELDPIVTGPYSPDAYEAGMRENMRVLRQALGAE